jgi:hypothetical protein|tara:strand:+ start:288 stop:752 length:465 start_codon:yes stop_codon:yes gene_type:complete
MAWTKDSVGGVRRLYNLALGTTLDANGLAMTDTSTSYSTALEVGVDVKLATMGCMLQVDESPAAGVVADLYASDSKGGTYSKVADDIVTAMTSSTAALAFSSGTVDLSSYPFSWFKVAVTTAGDESANHCRIVVSQDDGPQGDMSIGGVGTDPS